MATLQIAPPSLSVCQFSSALYKPGVDGTFVLDLSKTRRLNSIQLDLRALPITARSVQRYLAKFPK